MTLAFLPVSTRAQYITNADTSATLNVGSAWVGGIAPGPANIAVWNSIVQVNTSVTLGTNSSWGGIQILNPGGPISILADGNTLTNGTSGIDLSQATVGLTLDNAIALGANQTWSVTNSQTLTVAGVISGTSGLTITGGGAVPLGGDNTYSGGTVINGAIVEPGNASCFGTGGIILTNAYLLFNSSFGNGDIIVNTNYATGTNTLDLTSQGRGVVLDGSWAGDGTILVTNLSSGATLTFGENGNGGGSMNNFTGSIIVDDANSAGSLRFNNGGGNANTGNADMTMDLGNSSVTFYSRNNGATVNFGALEGGPNTIIKQGSSSSGTTTYYIGSLNENTTFAGEINDAESTSAQVAITKVGTGTLILSGNNDYTGTTTVSAGTLQIGDGVTSGEGTIGLGSGAVVNNATLLLNRPDDFSVDNNIGGTGTTVKTNSNDLTYDGADTQSGRLDIDEGTFSMDGTLTAPIFVAAGATFDVSENSGFTLISTLSGFGAVNGPLAAASGGGISPGITGQSGTLTITNGLTESGGVNNQFQLSSPGSTNDLINVIGNLTVSGVNAISPTAFNGEGIPQGTYPLISYSGTFTGSLTNFTINALGLNASLTQVANQIELIVNSSTTLRGPTNLTWIGGNGNYWDVDVSSNWENGTTLYSFLPGDMVLFANGTANTNVNVDAAVAPASVTVSSANNYTLFGNGQIEGSTGLYLSNNIGVLTLLTTNSYTGTTIVDGGTLAVDDLGAAGSDDNLGAVTTSSGDLVITNSTLEYVGATAATSRGATLGGAGATLVVSNSASELTINGILAGNGGLTIASPGILALSAVNTYNGNTVISNSTVAPENSGCFGNGGIIITNGYGYYQLDNFPSGDIIANTNYVTGTVTMDMASRSGLGVVFDGSWAGTGTVLVTNLASGATLTFGENGNGGGSMDNFTGSIVVDDPNSSGNVRFNNGGGNDNAGNSAMTMDLGNSSVTFYSRNNGATVNFGALEGGPNTRITQGSSGTGTSTYIIGGLNLNSTFHGQIVDDPSASDYLSLVKVGTGTLTLVGGVVPIVTNPTGFADVTNLLATNLVDYAGDTTISNGTLALVVPDSLTNSLIVTLAAPSAILDASDMGYVSNLTTPLPDGSTNELVTNSVFEVVSGHTLEGVGTLDGILQADSGSTFNIGLPTGAFNVTSNASLSGAITMSLNGNASSELLSPAFTVNPSATLLVTNVGAGLINGTTFTLFNHPVSFANGNVTLPPTDPTGTTSYIWTNNLASNGTITLTSGGLPPAVPPIAVSISGKTLTLSWGATGYTLQMQTNSLSVGISTNWVSVPGSTSLTGTNITINPSTPSAFFRLTQ